MGVSELFRFRTVRAVENKQTGFSALSVSSTVQSPVKQHLSRLAIDPGTLLGTFDWLLRVSTQLATSADRATPPAVIALLPTDWLTEVASGAWSALRQTLADTLASLALQVKNAKAAAGNYGVAVIPTDLCESVELGPVNAI